MRTLILFCLFLSSNCYAWITPLGTEIQRHESGGNAKIFEFGTKNLNRVSVVGLAYPTGYFLGSYLVYLSSQTMEKIERACRFDQLVYMIPLSQVEMDLFNETENTSFNPQVDKPYWLVTDPENEQSSVFMIYDFGLMGRKYKVLYRGDDD